MRARSEQDERDLLIAAVKTHLASTDWMSGMPGMDFETRDTYQRLLAKMERDAKYEVDHKALVADLVEDGLNANWADDLAREWLAIAERDSGMTEANRRGALVAHYISTGVPDDAVYEVTEALFARLTRNSERAAAVQSLVADLVSDGMERAEAAYVVELLQVFVGRVDGLIDNSHTQEMDRVMADDGVGPLRAHRLLVMLRDRMRRNAEAATTGG